MILSLIAAADEDNVIGLGNTIPWDIPADRKHFREMTEGSPVIMGRKTFDSIIERIDHPLPNRRNIVITRKGDLYAGEYDLVSSLDDALEIVRSMEVEEGFVIGGGQIYEQAMPMADRLYLTRIHHRFEGDVYFPEIRELDWEVKSEERHEADVDNPYAYTFLVYERKRDE